MTKQNDQTGNVRGDERGDRWYDPLSSTVLVLILLAVIAVAFGIKIDNENRTLKKRIADVETKCKAEEDAKIEFVDILDRQVNTFNRVSKEYKAKLKECGCGEE